MGRLSEYYDFINQEEIPNKLQILHRYTAISITPEIKKLRRKYRNELKAERKKDD
jgi:hypothetical protein